MIVRHKMPYVKPKRSVGVNITAHSGELVIPVETTDKLNKFLMSNKKEIPSLLKNQLKDLIQTVPQFEN
tara:strand:- start:2070 stop:2276 length:207 start_codon:yes stop_codon:yes gene_type:complete